MFSLDLFRSSLLVSVVPPKFSFTLLLKATYLYIIRPAPEMSSAVITPDTKGVPKNVQTACLALNALQIRLHSP